MLPPGGHWLCPPSSRQTSPGAEDWTTCPALLKATLAGKEAQNTASPSVVWGQVQHPCGETLAPSDPLLASGQTPLGGGSGSETCSHAHNQAMKQAVKFNTRKLTKLVELYEQCQLHNNQATASLLPSLPCPPPCSHHCSQTSAHHPSPARGLEAMKRPRGSTLADRGRQCLPEEFGHSTGPCPGKGRKACLSAVVSGQTGHYPLGRDPETRRPSSDLIPGKQPQP